MEEFCLFDGNELHCFGKRDQYIQKRHLAKTKVK
jgi:hypothetical protein